MTRPSVANAIWETDLPAGNRKARSSRSTLTTCSGLVLSLGTGCNSTIISIFRAHSFADDVGTVNPAHQGPSPATFSAVAEPRGTDAKNNAKKTMPKKTLGNGAHNR